MTLADRISEVLAANPNGLKASQIAKLIGSTRTEVNSYLYSHTDSYEIHEGYIWTPKAAGSSAPTPEPKRRARATKAAISESPILAQRYAYCATVEEFLDINEDDWIQVMKSGFHESYLMALGALQINVWKDCFRVLQRELPAFHQIHPGFHIVFEYALPYESGRRPDVLLVCNEYVIVLEFKKKQEILQADIDQANAYARDIEEYHYESREKDLSAILVLTEAHDVYVDEEGLIVCSGDMLSVALNDCVTDPTTKRNIDIWINSRYEPLPTIVEAARMIMAKEELPNIRRVGSTGIPDAINCLEQLTLYAREHSKHMIAFVTGVPGAGKTFLGLQFVYNVCQVNDQVNSVYLSGNGPLVRVLTDALHSSVFVKDLHKVINEFLGGGAKDFHNNVIVFDEGQRAWDKEQMAKAKRGQNNSEPDVMVRLAEERLDWCVLLVLVGEGQEIYKGENSGLGQWNDALNKAWLNWEVICPDKLAPIFKDQKVVKTKSRNRLDLTVSLRSHLAGDVSNFVNHLIDGHDAVAAQYVPEIIGQGFSMFVTRNLEAAKAYCRTRYGGQFSKRYGLIASSKEDRFMKRFGVDNGFYATSLRYMDIGKWFNTDARSGVSCCNLEKVVTEFGCQGLELDMPIICWGPDMKWNGYSWDLYRPNQAPDSDDNTYRTNSYRVLLTRGRDGFIVYVPDDRILDQTYKLFRNLGLKELKEGKS